jgi:hypothetical protein
MYASARKPLIYLFPVKEYPASRHPLGNYELTPNSAPVCVDSTKTHAAILGGLMPVEQPTL